jgi:hypothetical protein
LSDRSRLGTSPGDRTPEVPSSRSGASEGGRRPGPGRGVTPPSPACRRYEPRGKPSTPRRSPPTARPPSARGLQARPGRARRGRRGPGWVYGAAPACSETRMGGQEAAEIPQSRLDPRGIWGRVAGAGGMPRQGRWAGSRHAIGPRPSRSLAGRSPRRPAKSRTMRRVGGPPLRPALAVVQATPRINPALKSNR